MIQRRLARPLCKDNMQIREVLKKNQTEKSFAFIIDIIDNLSKCCLNKAMGEGPKIT